MRINRSNREIVAQDLGIDIEYLEEMLETIRLAEKQQAKVNQQMKDDEEEKRRRLMGPKPQYGLPTFEREISLPPGSLQVTVPDKHVISAGKKSGGKKEKAAPLPSEQAKRAGADKP